MTTELAKVRGCLCAVQRFVRVADIPAQQIVTFLYVAEHDEIAMVDLAEVTGVAQSSVSRNVARLGPGPNPREPGYGLLTAYEDPYYRKRKLVKLTPRGRELVKEIERECACPQGKA